MGNVWGMYGNVWKCMGKRMGKHMGNIKKICRKTYGKHMGNVWARYGKIYVNVHVDVSVHPHVYLLGI